MQEITMARKTAAYKVHMDILAAGEVAAESFSTFCRLLKTMRDDKLYQELEYSSFETYCENAVGMSYKQAFKYIKVLENFGEGNIPSRGCLGIKKLELIGAAPTEAREELLEKADDMTTRQIEAAVKEFKQRLQEAQAAAAKSQEWADKQAQYAEESNKRAREAEWELGKKETSIDSLKKDLEYAKKQLVEAKDKGDIDKIKRYEATIVEQVDKLEKLEYENEQLKKQLHATPIEAQAAKIVVPVAVKNSIYQKVVDVYESLLKLTQDEILIYAEVAVPNKAEEIEKLDKAFKVIEKLESNLYMKEQGII